MRVVPGNPRRRSLRLKDYDYAQAGAYFVTICTQDRLCLFGEVVDDVMRLSDAGEMASSLWKNLPAQFPAIAIDVFVVMPNHLHGIIVFPDIGPATRVAPASGAKGPTEGVPLVRVRTPTLGKVVGAFKSAATVEYVHGVKAKGWTKFRQRLWQRNYYEHVIRDETGLDRIRRYIEENPLRWAVDDENPNRVAELT
jgi:REP element-mobilizing transposase RayT